MRNWRLLLVPAIGITGLMTLLPSCKKNDDPPAKPLLSFTALTKTVTESDGTIKIEMKLDKPATQDFSVTYELTGDAVDKVESGGTTAYDYEIKSTYLETNFKKDSTVANISLKLYSDFAFEDDETIEISIKSVDTENIEITRDDEMIITVTQEDGLGILLIWDYADVDMDLFMWWEDLDELVLSPIYSITPSFEAPEFLFVPTVIDDGSYGLSCNYYQGTADPMNFEVDYIPFINGEEGDPIIREGTYGLEHRNGWDTTDIDPILVMTFEKSGDAFSDFSEIEEPAEFSRVNSSPSAILNTLKREKALPGASRRLPLRYLNRR